MKKYSQRIRARILKTTINLYGKILHHTPDFSIKIWYYLARYARFRHRDMALSGTIRPIHHRDMVVSSIRVQYIASLHNALVLHLYLSDRIKCVIGSPFSWRRAGHTNSLWSADRSFIVAPRLSTYNALQLTKAITVVLCICIGMSALYRDLTFCFLLKLSVSLDFQLTEIPVGSKSKYSPYAIIIHSI